MKNFEKRFENKKASLKDISAIEESERTFAKRAEIEKFVEWPLIEACQKLYDKNIKTVSSSANEKDVQTKEAYIVLDLESLSEKNRQIGEERGEVFEKEGKKLLKIVIPINESFIQDTERIRDEANKIADVFEKQPADWIPEFTLEDLKKAYGILPDEKEYNDPSVWQEEGFFYSEEDDTFYLSEEHFKKTKKD